MYSTRLAKELYNFYKNYQHAIERCDEILADMEVVENNIPRIDLYLDVRIKLKAMELLSKAKNQFEHV